MGRSGFAAWDVAGGSALLQPIQHDKTTAEKTNKEDATCLGIDFSSWKL
jgi:hypothetical protein